MTERVIAVLAILHRNAKHACVIRPFKSLRLVLGTSFTREILIILFLSFALYRPVLSQAVGVSTYCSQRCSHLGAASSRASAAKIGFQIYSAGENRGIDAALQPQVRVSVIRGKAVGTSAKSVAVRALEGLAIGAVAGGLIGYASGKYDERNCQQECGISPRIGLALGAMLGGAIGLVVGVATAHD